MIWIAFFVLIGMALLLLLRPLLRGTVTFADSRSSELAVYRDQLRELDADLGRGLISLPEAEGARAEIKRKMLNLAPAPQVGSNTRQAARAVRAVVVVVVPAVAVALYLTVGEPDLPGATFIATPEATSDTQAAAPQVGDVDTMVDRLATRLKKNPDDAQGWRMLGWSYFHLDRFADAAKAFERSIALDGSNAELRSQYGEAVVRTAGGLVTPDALKIFDAALAIDDREPRAQFFRGLWLEQHNKPKEALAVWIKIIREGQADADWLPALRQRAAELATKLKLDPANELPPETSVELEPNRIVAGSQSTPVDMIDRLSKRLEASPDDLEGWLMLARSYRTVGKTELARAALARAKELFANAPVALQRIVAAQDDLTRPVSAEAPPAGKRGPTSDEVAAAAQLSPDQQDIMISGMVSNLEKRLRTQPNDLDGWLMLAKSRKVLGDANAARTAIGRAEELFRDDAEARARISQVAAELQLN